MARGRNQGWEEAVQHGLMSRYLDDHGLRYMHEFCVDAGDFGNRMSARVDFLVDHGASVELIECKQTNHPIHDVSAAIGQVAVYRELMLMQKTPESRDIRLGVCFVHGFKTGYGIWREAHQALVASLARRLGSDIAVYLACPKQPEFAGAAHWNDPSKFEIRLVGAGALSTSKSS